MKNYGIIFVTFFIVVYAIIATFLSSCTEQTNDLEENQQQVVDCTLEEIPYDFCNGDILIEYTGEITAIRDSCEFSFVQKECTGASGCIEQDEDDVCGDLCEGVVCNNPTSECTLYGELKIHDTEELGECIDDPSIWDGYDYKKGDCYYLAEEYIVCPNGCEEDENGAYCL
jgi:hypothetical protein